MEDETVVSTISVDKNPLKFTNILRFKPVVETCTVSSIAKLPYGFFIQEKYVCSNFFPNKLCLKPSLKIVEVNLFNRLCNDFGFHCYFNEGRFEIVIVNQPLALAKTIALYAWSVKVSSYSKNRNYLNKLIDLGNISDFGNITICVASHRFYKKEILSFLVFGGGVAFKKFVDKNITGKLYTRQTMVLMKSLNSKNSTVSLNQEQYEELLKRVYKKIK